jgi:hypothetical protein
MKSPKPYFGREVALATKHGKQKAIARPFKHALGISLVTPEHIDTDLLGTFSGEVAREGSPREVCERKARMGITSTGLTLGVANEGSFGPHPFIPFLPVGFEVMTFIDDDRGIVLTETLLAEKTNYSHRKAVCIDVLDEWLEAVRFPSHALVVKPTGTNRTEGLTKGLVTRIDLADAIRRAAVISSEGTASIETDMRAHLNPTRMHSIRRLAFKLARRLTILCPACSAPGWGRSGVIKGLPCRDCETPTELPLRSIFRCGACYYREEKPCFEENASPQFCPFCNP